LYQVCIDIPKHYEGRSIIISILKLEVDLINLGFLISVVEAYFIFLKKNIGSKMYQQILQIKLLKIFVDI